MAQSLRAKQPKRGVVTGTKGYVEIDDYPRATTAKVTYTPDAHTTTSEVLSAGDQADALVYEVRDFQRYIDEGTMTVSCYYLTMSAISWTVCEMHGA